MTPSEDFRISTSCGRLQTPTPIHTLRVNGFDSLLRLSTSLRLPRFLQKLLIRAKCYEYVLELVSFVQRIRLLRRARKVEIPFRQLFLDLGPVYEQDESGHLVPCKSTHGRTSCIQRIRANYPWATSLDWFCALEGWDAAVQWALGNHDTASNSELSSHESLEKQPLLYH